MHEDHFKYAKDPIRQRIYNERIKPNLKEDPYSVSLKIESIIQVMQHVSIFCVGTTFIDKLSLLLINEY